MLDLDLDENEYIILQTSDLVCYGATELSLKDLILTNKNLIYVIARKKLLKKYNEIQKHSLESLARKDGHIDATVSSYKNINACIKIKFKSGIDYITFSNPSKKLARSWIVEINKAALGIIVEVGEPSKGGFGSITKGIKTTLLGTFGVKHEERIKIIEMHHSSTPEQNSSYSHNENNTNTGNQLQACWNCGSFMQSGHKFCSRCGASAKIVPDSSIEQAQILEKNQRQIEYVGKVLKCPNCGCVIGKTTMICPDCGMKINREEASESIQAFYNKLMEFESQRKLKRTGLFAQDDGVDKQVLAFIRSYPIPNSIEDIVEFFMLAANNINVNMSKNSFLNSLDTALIEKQISDAWVVKMQQLYKKAERLFPKDELFLQIQDIYFSKMRELKFKI